MTNANICKDDSGSMVLEIWNGGRKMTLYVGQEGVIQDVLVVSEAGDINEANLHWALDFVSTSVGK